MTVRKNEIDFIVNEKEAFEVKTNPEKFREKNYKTFFKSYPDIDLSIVSIDKKCENLERYKIKNVWEI